MYTPKHFEEARLDVLHGLVQQHALASLVTLTAQGLVANHIPLHLRVDGSPFGTLVGHVARSNPLWQDFDAGTAVLAIFQGPSTYISPSWYVTKQEHGKVVPTWNYAVVHATGPLQVRDDPVWVRAQLHQLVSQHEARFAKPWGVDDAPRDYTDRLISAIVGIEIPITQLTGKWKVSQNQPAANQATVVRGLQAQADDASHAMAALVQTYAAR